IGDGSERDRLKKLASELGLADRVEFIPTVAHARRQEYYHRADIFALATHYEGFCIPVLEAMAAGLPVVASQTQPLPEILGGCGLIAPNEAAAFRAAIKRLLADGDLALSLGRKAQARAESLDGQVMEEREVRLYRSLMG
ncbi:MAG: glycosyltransferase family 4 protein, partial [Deltaproteobacteria bacterium]|nr:glycosyltransferase family 4 protein [Deltaproteobacteria bacterium]